MTPVLQQVPDTIFCHNALLWQYLACWNDTMYLLLCTSIAHGVTLYDGKHFLQVSTCEKSSMTMGAGGEQQHIPACD